MKDIQGRLRVRVAVFACVAAVALGIDQLTKMWAQQALGDGRTVPLIPGLLSLTLVHNPGASLGLGSGSTWLISLLAVVACVVMAVLAARTISMRWTVMFAFVLHRGELRGDIGLAGGLGGLRGQLVDLAAEAIHLILELLVLLGQRAVALLGFGEFRRSHLSRLIVLAGDGRRGLELLVFALQ